MDWSRAYLLEWFTATTEGFCRSNCFSGRPLGEFLAVCVELVSDGRFSDNWCDALAFK